MKKPTSPFLLLTAVAPFAIAVLCAADDKPTTEKSASEPLDFPAVTYFENSCARCHGPYGVNYDLKHLALSSDARLREVIATMADGPGQAPLDVRQVAAQTAYHRSFMDGKPFVIVNKAIPGDQKLILSGEVVADTTVKVSLAGKTIDATITDNEWKAELPAGADWKEAIVTATHDKAITELKAADGHSHGK